MRLRQLSLYRTAALSWSYSSTLHISGPHRHHGDFSRPATMFFFGHVMAVLHQICPTVRPSQTRHDM